MENSMLADAYLDDAAKHAISNRFDSAVFNVNNNNTYNFQQNKRLNNNNNNYNNTTTSATTNRNNISNQKNIIELIDSDNSFPINKKIDFSRKNINTNSNYNNQSSLKQNLQQSTQQQQQLQLQQQQQQQHSFRSKKIGIEELLIQKQLESEMNRNPAMLTKSNQQAAKEESAAAEEKATPKPVRITSRIVFLKVGQIDTRNERYDAEAYLECSWEDDEIFKILSDPNMAKNSDTKTSDSFRDKNPSGLNQNQSNLLNLKNILNNINYLEYDPNTHWSPQIYCENAIGDLKEEIRYKLEIVEKFNPDQPLGPPTLPLPPPPPPLQSQLSKTKPPNMPQNKSQPPTSNLSPNPANMSGNLTVKVSEMRKVRGVFYERLELYDFPMDIQEISITLTSKRSVDEVVFIENKKDASSINTEDFLDQQEWDLFDFVECANKTIYDPWRKYDRSAFSVKSFISRKPGYYLYNAYMLIFLITVLGFVPFAFEPNGPQFRCQVTGLLLLTSVNFRWIVTQRLPSVPYLTSLDKYAIGSLLYLVLFCVWHSIIGSTVISPELTVKRRVDSIVLYCAAGFYLLYNFGYIIWFFKMARNNSNSLKEGREEYKRVIAERAKEFEEIERRKEEQMMQQQQPILKQPRTPNMAQRQLTTTTSLANQQAKQNQMSLNKIKQPMSPQQVIKTNQSTNQLAAANNETAFLMA